MHSVRKVRKWGNYCLMAFVPSVKHEVRSPLENEG